MLFSNLANLKASLQQGVFALAFAHADHIGHALELCTLANSEDDQAALLTLFASLGGLLHNGARLIFAGVTIFFLQVHLKLLFLQKALGLYHRHILDIGHGQFLQIATKNKVRYNGNRHHAGGNVNYKLGII